MTTETAERPALEPLLALFDRNVASGRDQIRDLLERDPQAFREGVVRAIKSSPASSRSLQFAVGQLAENDLILPALCDPSLNLEGAIALAKAALQVDPMIDVTLAKNLADATARGEPVKNGGRLMDILGEISNGNRITSSLMRLWRSSDPQMRSKAVLLIGRGNRSTQWAQSRMAETDPRIRASAVEALWTVETTESKELLRTAASDGNNRVAGNALFALHRMGDTAAVGELFKMAASELPQFRSSAAWAMGETGDPRFSETLGRLMSESNALVRKRAFKELSRLKAATKARQGHEWRVAGRLLPAAGNMRQIGFEASSSDGSAVRLLPTQFILSEDGKPVTQYQVEAQPTAGALALTFLLPHSTGGDSPAWVQAAAGCLRWKRPTDLWCATFYLPADEKTEGTPNPPQFTADAHVAAAALQEAPATIECPEFWDAVRTSAQAVNAPEDSARHLIVYNQASPAAPEGLADIVSSAVASNTVIHGVSLASCPPLEELSRGTQGSFRLVKSQLELSKQFEEAHLALIPRFLISYPPTGPSARAINIRVFDATGWGETTVPL